MRIDSSGNLLFSNADTVIGSNTSDGSDNQALYLCGGGNQTAARGANLRLHGNEDSPAGDVLLYSGTASGSDILLSAYSSTSTIQFATNGGTERMRLDSSGSLVLQDGTTYTTNAPTYRGSLILAGASGATSYGGIEFHPNAGGGAGYGSKIGASDAEMTFSTRSNSATFTQRMVIDANGQIGIGTGNPERKVHIVGDTTSEGQYPLGLDAVNSDYTLEFRRSGVSQWWIAQGAGSFRIHENGVADMFRINATDGNIVLGRTRSIATETSYTQQTYQFWLDAHVNGTDEAAEEKDAVFSKIWRKSAVLHPGKYSNGNYYVGIGVTSADTVNYVTFKVNLYKATQLYCISICSKLGRWYNKSK